MWSQTISVGGTVVDGDMPLPGASVTVKGSYAGTATDLDGKFALTAESGATLVFSYIGYLRQELTVTNTVSDLTVTLKPDVVAWKKLSSSAMETSNEAKSPVGDRGHQGSHQHPCFENGTGLQGRAAGVQVTQNSGQPGSTQTIRIRGLGSINNWIRCSLSTASSGGMTTEPSDIESISILKDAASTAIYGARGANGGVDRHEEGFARQQGDADLRQLHWHSGAVEAHGAAECEEYATLMNESRAAAECPCCQGWKTQAPGQGTNWQDAMFQRAPMSNHSVLYTNGTETSSIAMGASHFSQDGIIGGEKGRFYAPLASMWWSRRATASKWDRTSPSPTSSAARSR